jgi:hypothetical protein
MKHWRRLGIFLGLAAGILGVGLVLYLSLKSSSRMTEVNWLPAGLTRWADAHGRFRNFPAFGLIALPFLILASSRVRRFQIAGALALLVALLEVLQNWIPARSPDVWDVVWASLGLLAALAGAELLTWVFTQRRPAAPAQDP